ncbi:MAG TPA: NADH oxidase, partial [Anaerolineae bacterium]|nr:NADH oxidase [Anaerolineae bacterium]
QGIETHVHHEVTAIDLDNRAIIVRNLDNDSEFAMYWDKLVLTTGGVAVRPPIPGLELEGVFTLRTPEDAIAIKEWLKRERPRKAVVVGAGYVGLEMAEALATNGLHVTVMEMLPQVLPNMDVDMAELVAEELHRQGIDLKLEHRVEAFEGNGGRVKGVLSTGEDVLADIVLFNIGVRPAVKLAQDARIALGPTGAVAVDDHQRTNVPGIWAAGDVAEAHHLVTGEPAYIPLGTTANKQGRVAGENAAGGDAAFHGIVGTAVVKVFDLEVARTGLSEQEAIRKRFDVTSVRITASSRAHYYPGHKPLHVKLIFEKESQHLLGGQIIGQEGTSKRIDIVATALHAGWTVEELRRLDLSYAPPFAPVWDPVLVAANVAAK